MIDGAIHYLLCEGAIVLSGYALPTVCSCVSGFGRHNVVLLESYPGVVINYITLQVV